MFITSIILCKAWLYNNIIIIIIPFSIDIGVGQRAVCNWGDEVDWHLTQTGVVKEALDALQEVIDYTLDGEK